MSSKLSDDIQLPRNGHVIKNRLVKAAMVEGLSSILTGQPNESHYRLYKTWADSGFGMIISGNVCVASDHLGTPGDLRLPAELTEITLAPWSTLARSMSSSSNLAILQLVHTGRQSVRCAGRLPLSAPLAPSSIRVSTSPSSLIGKIAEALVFQTPKEMTKRDIQDVVRQFVHGAILASKAGFHGVELHASHGYLLSSFLSPKTNKRSDEYGNDTEGRLKIVIEIVDAIREGCERPFVLGIKLNAADYMEGGLSEQEALRHVELLTLHGGLDFIEISGGSYENLAFLEDDTSPSRTSKREAIFSAFASQAKETALSASRTSSHATVPLIMCTGGFRTRSGIENALREDAIDLIGIGRPAAADPTWVKRILAPSTSPALSDASKPSNASADNCVTYKVTGGSWLQALVPLHIVGGGMTTLWHELQMARISRGQTTRVEWSFERLFIVEFVWSRIGSSVGVVLLVVLLAWVAARIL